MNAEAESEEWVIECWDDTGWAKSDLHNMTLSANANFWRLDAHIPWFTFSRAALILKVRERMQDQKGISGPRIIYRLRNVRTGDILPSLLL